MTRKVRDNGAEACIHFQKAETIAFFHNSREAFIPETSNEELRKKNECDRTAEEARQMFEELSAKGDENFLKNCGRRTNMKAENKLWESALNLRARHTLEDVQRVNARIQEITGFIPIQTALHRDEGHTDEKTGDFVQNVHAQTTWLTQDPETGKSLAYQLYDKKDVYRKIQDVVAEELGMIRGKPAEITGARHFKNMRDYKQMKRAEGKLNKEWEQKLAEKQAEWQAKMAEKQKEWEAKQAEREAKQTEWEAKIPEIVAARERRSKFISDKLDWESARDGKKLAYEMEMLGISFAGVSNPSGNIIIEAQKDAIRNIFYMLGTTAQLAVFLMKKTLANDEKLAADAKIFNVESTLLRAVDYVANSDPANAEELKKRIQRTFLTIPEEKRRELFEYALENAPTPELKNDIKALIEGRFEDIARSEQAQKRIENRDLRAELKEYSEELKRIRDELKQMDEENRILNLAERAILREKGAQRDEYAEQESQNRERLNDLKQLKDEQKALKKAIDEQREDKDAKTIRELNEKIAELTSKIAQITAENVAKQKELERELEQEKAKRKEAEIITPKQLEDAFDIIDKLENELKQREEPKPEQKPEPKIEKPEPIREEQKPEKIEQKQPEPKQPEPIKKDDFTNIYGYSTPKPEPRRRLDDYEARRPREDDRPRYEPEKLLKRSDGSEQSETKPEPEPEPFRDPWQEITDAMEKWKKCESEAEKKMLSIGIYQNIEKYEKSGWDIPLHRQMSIDAYRRALAYDPAAAIHRERERELELERERELEMERKRQQAELEKKYEDVTKKNVKQEADARQTALKKKKKDELEMGIF